LLHRVVEEAAVRYGLKNGKRKHSRRDCLQRI
jgi:hypothetical protein